MDQNEKVLLKRNLLFFAESKNKALMSQPGKVALSKQIIKKINGMIDHGEIQSMLNVEAAYDFCFEKMQEDREKLDDYAKEISTFLS
mgnify:CR=1 FL=1